MASRLRSKPGRCSKRSITKSGPPQVGSRQAVRARRVSDQEQLTSRRRGLKITHCSAPIRGGVTLTRHTGGAKEKAAAATTGPLSSGCGPHYTPRRACDGLVSRGGCSDSRMGRPRELQGVHSPPHVTRAGRLARFYERSRGKGGSGRTLRFPPQKHQGGLGEGTHVRTPVRREGGERLSDGESRVVFHALLGFSRHARGKVHAARLKAGGPRAVVSPTAAAGTPGTRDRGCRSRNRSAS